jgi:hypothetical protein
MIIHRATCLSITFAHLHYKYRMFFFALVEAYKAFVLIHIALRPLLYIFVCRCTLKTPICDASKQHASYTFNY